LTLLTSLHLIRDRLPLFNHLPPPLLLHFPPPLLLPLLLPTLPPVLLPTQNQRIP
jgi:hypothetical protein